MFRKPFFFANLLPVLSLLVIFVSGQCYSYTGVQRDSTYMACNGSAPVSMCCHLGNGNNGGDVCGSGSTYGLCGITGTTIWRESCTDPTWESPICLKLCLGANDTAITVCSNGSLCCGKNNVDCCDSGGGKYIVNNQAADSPDGATSSDFSESVTLSVSSTDGSSGSESPASSTTSSFSISSISLSTTGSSSISIGEVQATSPIASSVTSQPSVIISTVYQPSPTTISTNTSTNERQPLSIGAKAGICGAAAVITILAFAGFVWRRKRKVVVATVDSEKHILEADSIPKFVYRVEADSVSRPSEMGLGRRGEPVEML